MYFANQIFPFNATKRRVILEKLPFKDPIVGSCYIERMFIKCC